MLGGEQPGDGAVFEHFSDRLCHQRSDGEHGQVVHLILAGHRNRIGDDDLLEWCRVETLNRGTRENRVGRGCDDALRAVLKQRKRVATHYGATVGNVVVLEEEVAA